MSVYADGDKQVGMDNSDRRGENMYSKHSSTKANESRRVSDGEGCIETEESRGVAEDIKQRHGGNTILCVEDPLPKRETDMRMRSSHENCMPAQQGISTIGFVVGFRRTMVAKETNQKLDSAFECVRPMFIQPGFLCKVARLSEPRTRRAATLRGRNHGQTFREQTQLEI